MSFGWALVAILCGSATAEARPDRAPFALVSVNDQARAKALEVQADKAWDDGRFAEAAVGYDRAWRLCGDPALLLRMSGAYEQTGDIVRALEALDWYRARAGRDEQASLRDRRERLAARLVASGS